MIERTKASDIFRETNYVFSKKVPFLEAFPEIDDFRIEVSESPDMIWGGQARARTYTKESPPGEFVDCTNSLCYSGGVSIGEILREMISKRKADLEVSKGCRGYEGSPKGRRKYRSCMHSFGIKVTLKYKDGSQKTSRYSEPPSA